MQFPTVTIFMDGFADGVEYYNEQKSKDVKVVGWDVDVADRHLHRRLRGRHHGQADARRPSSTRAPT